MNLEFEHVPIDQLNEATYNPRTISKDEFNGLKASLNQFGFVDPVVANSRNKVIVGGHMRIKAWQELGNDTVPVVWVNLDDKQERKLNVVLNSQKISGTYDELKLAQLLETFKFDDDYKALRLAELEPADGSDKGSGSGNNEPQEYLTDCPCCDASIVVTIDGDEVTTRENV